MNTIHQPPGAHYNITNMLLKKVYGERHEYKSRNGHKQEWEMQFPDKVSENILEASMTDGTGWCLIWEGIVIV